MKITILTQELKKGINFTERLAAVSYTHLDVYKRQMLLYPLILSFL